MIYSKLKNEVKELKNTKELNEKILNSGKEVSNPENIQFSRNLTKDAFSYYSFDNTFDLFKSIDNIIYMIYTNKNRSIISYNVLSNEIINQVKKSHNEYISNFKHYLDKINRRDLLISVSAKDNNIKLWNIKNWECLIDLKNINENGYLYSACFLNYNDKICLISTNFNFGNPEPIKIFDLEGNKINTINSSDDIDLIETFYDKKLCIHYIVIGINEYIKTFNYNEQKYYNKYYEEGNFGHGSIHTLDDNYLIKIIESSFDGYIRVWNFHTAKLLNKIKICNEHLYGICIWNNKYLFVGCEDKIIRLVDLNEEKVVKDLKGHSTYIVTIKKILHPKYGDCLISVGNFYEQLKLWINKKFIDKKKA